MNNSVKVNIKSQLRYLHDRKLPEVKFTDNYNDKAFQKKYKKNERINVKNNVLENVKNKDLKIMEEKNNK